MSSGFVCTACAKTYSCHSSRPWRKTHENHRPKKINAFCPAEIILLDQNGIYSVKYTSTHIGHKNELCHITKLPEKGKLILADNSNIIKYPEKLPRTKKIQCKNNGTNKDGCESQIADDTNNSINTEDPQTLEPIKKKQYKDILSRHKNVAFIKDNCDTQDDANFVDEIEELETLEASNEIQEFLSRYESIDVVEDNNDIQIAGDAFELVVDDSVHLDVDDDTIQLVEENLNYGINLEKRETLEKLKEKLKKTFLEALDKAITYEQCELIRKIIAPLHPTLDKCILMRGIEEEFDFTPVKCIAKKSKDPKLAKSISRKGTEVLDPMLAKYIPEKGIKKRLDHMSSILKKKTQKELVSMPSKCNPKKRTNEVLDPALAKSISDDGIQKELDPTSAKRISEKGTEVLDPMLVKCIVKEGIEKELDHILAKCISTEETQKYLGPTSAKYDGTQKELGPKSSKCIPEQGTVEELDPTSGQSKNRLNCEEMELKTPNLDVLKNPLNCDQKQSAIKLNHKPLAYKSPLYPTLNKCIRKGGTDEELATCIADERTQNELDSTLAKCNPEKGTNQVLDPALAECIAEKGTEEELDPTQAKCIPEEGI
ncbi:PREDICTED: uncharacterized protein LOC108566900 [Nicrophorus vespilloides]|uniref:Uncharacterized protein LOC108566900 n=1 Tax=Nicrophorus vespilloides TaxID=110193 RepID=A0ABM1N6R1_NICVS|nr:PREDICTED: uncharacterized protein LOC108566900 [Nicrophorus vespilloides]